MTAIAAIGRESFPQCQGPLTNRSGQTSRLAIGIPYATYGPRMASVNIALHSSASPRTSGEGLLDGRLVDGVRKAQKTEGYRTSNDKPNSANGCLCLGIDMGEELGERKSSVPSERPCLTTGWQH